jgi:hypothetical protein
VSRAALARLPRRRDRTTLAARALGEGVRYRALRLTLIAAGVLATRTSACAEPTTSITPVFHQLVVFTLPAQFRAVSERTKGSFYIREHLPEGESLEKWTRMITLTGVRDLASNANATPQLMVERMAEGFRRHCPDSFANALLGPQTIDGFPAFEAIARCGHQQAGADAYSETAILLAVKGSSDYFTLQWVERGADAHGPGTLDQAYWTRQFDRLRPIRLCAITPGEAPPYPSCLRAPQ